MTTTNLGPRPSDPSKISFADDCFAVTGYEMTYTVTRSALHSGPARFTSRKEAECFAAKCRRSVTETRREIRRRVRWY